jgi:hypothetical protein
MDQALVNASFTVTGKAETQQVLEKAIQQVVCTQDPITNYEVDRFFEVMEALDFHAQELKARYGSKARVYEQGLSQGQLDGLLALTLSKIKRKAKHTLLEPFPSQGHRFNIKLASLLSVEQKRIYYNEVLKTLISEVKAKLVR